jgi:probable DNA metabolism protein
LPCRYVYDGGFEGFLCVLLELVEGGEEAEEIVPESRCGQGSLLLPVRRVGAQAAAADAAAEMIRSRISPRAFYRVALAFLTEEEGVEMDIWRYLGLGLEKGAQAYRCRQDQRVRRVHDAARAVGRERHRLLGFLRFRRLVDGTLYAPMQPRYDVLCLVAPHFMRRMRGEELFIHDLGRHTAFLYRGGEAELVRVPPFPPQQAEGEAFFQELWREYLKAVSVPERRNPRLQASGMPRRYWRWLVESPGQAGAG